MPVHPECTTESIPSEGEEKTPTDRVESRRLVVYAHDQTVKPTPMAMMVAAIKPTRIHLDEVTYPASFWRFGNLCQPRSIYYTPFRIHFFNAFPPEVFYTLFARA
jgi:hypothetical protein